MVPRLSFMQILVFFWEICNFVFFINILSIYSNLRQNLHSKFMLIMISNTIKNSLT